MPFYENPELTSSIIKIFILVLTASMIAVGLAPILINFLYKNKLWRKEARTKTITGDEASVFHELHKEREVSVPRFGGILIVGATIVTALIFLALSKSGIPFFEKINFVSRNQTWLPFFTLITASLLGLADDILQVKGQGKYIAGGMTFTRRLVIVILIGLIGALWFYFKLDVHTIHIPLVGDLEVGIWLIPLFVVVTLACWSGGVVDGLDGLAGGVLGSIFAAFGIISFANGQIDLAAFCVVIVGTILSFLWFNIPPARFYMGETGMLGLTATLAVIAFLSDSIIVLPIIAGLIVVEVFSIILQLISKRIRHKKIWLCTPIHHHFEALGWPHYKVTMRFWIIGIILAIIGVAIRLLG